MTLDPKDRPAVRKKLEALSEEVSQWYDKITDTAYNQLVESGESEMGAGNIVHSFARKPVQQSVKDALSFLDDDRPAAQNLVGQRLSNYLDGSAAVSFKALQEIAANADQSQQWAHELQDFVDKIKAVDQEFNITR